MKWNYDGDDDDDDDDDDGVMSGTARQNEIPSERKHFFDLTERKISLRRDFRSNGTSSCRAFVHRLQSSSLAYSLHCNSQLLVLMSLKSLFFIFRSEHRSSGISFRR